jgi:hypothetical protein
MGAFGRDLIAQAQEQLQNVDLAGDLSIPLVIFLIFEDCHLARIPIVGDSLKGKRRASNVTAKACHPFLIRCG